MLAIYFAYAKYVFIRLSILLLRLVGQGVDAHLLEHGHEAVGARRGEVLAEADAVDEVEVGGEDLCGAVAG